MKLEDNIIKHYLKNVYFINGTAYAGKSTMCAMLAEKFNLFHCEENYCSDYFSSIASFELQPKMCCFKTMKNWQEFIGRTESELNKRNKGLNSIIEFNPFLLPNER